MCLAFLQFSAGSLAASATDAILESKTNVLVLVGRQQGKGSKGRTLSGNCLADLVFYNGSFNGKRRYASHLSVFAYFATFCSNLFSFATSAAAISFCALSSSGIFDPESNQCRMF